MESETPAALARAAEIAIAFRGSLPERRVGALPGLTEDELRRRLGGPLPDDGVGAVRVVEDLAASVDDGLVAMSAPRYFGFVIGGSLPASLAVDWLVSTWDQNLGMYMEAPAAAIVEEVAAGWVLDLLGLPAGASVGFTTAATTASVTALAAARHAVLRDAGWDVEEDGLVGAPPIHVVVGSLVHASVLSALRLIGLGRRTAIRVACDDAGRMRPDALRHVLAGLPPGPTIVAAQAGEVNTGSFDPLAQVADAVRARPGAWLHIDGAFGLWAAASPRLRHLAAGAELADSWSTDAHKWLNVPYDAGIAIVRDVAAHRAAMSVTAAYFPAASGATRDPMDYVPEQSRRARGTVVYAALRELGRSGVAALVEASCSIAGRLAAGLSATPDVAVLNDVVLNQVLVRFADDDAVTRDVIRRVQGDGTAWMGGTTWQGRAAMRISVSNWATSEADADRTVEAIRRCLRASVEAGPATAAPTTGGSE